MQSKLLITQFTITIISIATMVGLVFGAMYDISAYHCIGIMIIGVLSIMIIAGISEKNNNVKDNIDDKH